MRVLILINLLISFFLSSCQNEENRKKEKERDLISRFFFSRPIRDNGSGKTSQTDTTNNTTNRVNIISFSPISGPIGTKITILGNNFSLSPSENIVRFDGNTAIVNQVVSTQILIVTVPVGTVSGLITITVNTNTDTAIQQFKIGI